MNQTPKLFDFVPFDSTEMGSAGRAVTFCFEAVGLLLKDTSEEDWISLSSSYFLTAEGYVGMSFDDRLYL